MCSSSTRSALSSLLNCSAPSFDLLGDVVAIDQRPAALAHESCLLHQPGIEVALEFARTGAPAGEQAAWLPCPLRCAASRTLRRITGCSDPTFRGSSFGCGDRSSAREARAGERASSRSKLKNAPHPARTSGPRQPSPGQGGERDEMSHPLHKTIHHALFAGLVEADGQLVAVHGGDVAVAEFLVKHAGADLKR